MKHETVLTIEDEIKITEAWCNGSRTASDLISETERFILTKQAEMAQPVAWMIDTHGVPDVAINKEDLGLLANRYAFPLYAHPPTSPALLEAAHAAWFAIGADVAGLEWDKFVSAIEAHKKGQS